MKISPALTKFAADSAKAAGGAILLQFATTIGNIAAERMIDAFRPKEKVVEVVEEEEIEIVEEPETSNE